MPKSVQKLRREVAADNAVVWSTDRSLFQDLSTISRTSGGSGANDMLVLLRNKLQHSTCSLANASASGVHPVLFVMSATFI
jgi:hypothetical protein